LAKRVLIISHDIVGDQMAGPGIRYYQLAYVLAHEFVVTLAIPSLSLLQNDQLPFKIIQYQTGHDIELTQIIQQTDVAIVPAIWLQEAPALIQAEIPLVIDGYNPYIAETLARLVDDISDLQQRLPLAYQHGDFFICASERQRDWWLGLLEAQGRINHNTFQQDSSLRQLIDCVPFGLPDIPPQQTRSIIKGVWPGIEKEDTLILWGGGLWRWLDPLTAIKAVAEIYHHHYPTIRLIFPGTQHPNPGVATIPMHNETARQLAQDLGVINKAVFFGEWIAYDDWPNVLLECDLAISLHYDNFETRLAFRSRLFDYIWAKLPMIITQGDATSELMAPYPFSYIVDYEDTDGVVQAILTMLDTPVENFTASFEQANRQFTWQQAAQPLIKFCHHPTRATDKTAYQPSENSHRATAETNPHVTIEHLTTEINHLVEQNSYLIIERDRWQNLVYRYEQGRFMRFMRWLKNNHLI